MDRHIYQIQKQLHKRFKFKQLWCWLCSEIKIAYNGSHITSSNDLIDCFVVKDVPNYDLGIIQIADGSNFWNVCKLGEAPKWSYEQMEVGWSNHS